MIDKLAQQGALKRRQTAGDLIEDAAFITGQPLMLKVEEALFGIQIEHKLKIDRMETKAVSFGFFVNTSRLYRHFFEEASRTGR